MKVAESHQIPPKLIRRTNAFLHLATKAASRVKALMQILDISKVVEPDGISACILQRCCAELAPAYTTIFNTCMQQRFWPQSWKSARVVPVHKKRTTKYCKRKTTFQYISIINSVQIFWRVHIHQHQSSPGETSPSLQQRIWLPDLLFLIVNRTSL